MKHEDKLKLAHKKREDKLATEKTKQEAALSKKEQRLAEIQTIKESIEKLADALEVKVDVDLQPLIDKLQVLSELPDSFKDLKKLSSKLLADSEKEVNIKGFRELWETLVRSNNDLHRLTKEQVLDVSNKFADLQVYLEQLTETINQGQEPGDYKPVRIVVGGDGVPLAFLSQFPSSRGGGGSNSASEVIIKDENGEKVTVTDGKLDVNATVSGVASFSDSGDVEKKGLVDADRHVQTDVLTLPAITGTVTANAGTNLNTSTLALETTATAIKNAVEIMDDWDESDRAKVNPIVGQAGLQGGSGTVSANTQRVVLATDVALPTGTNNIGSVAPLRPSQATGRVYKTARLSNQTTDQLLYTNTVGKTLYVTTLSIFVFNASTTNVGVLELKDGTTAAGTLIYPTLMSAAGVGAVTAATAVSHVLVTFTEPLQFTTGMFLDITSGTLTYSAFVVGYEE